MAQDIRVALTLDNKQFNQALKQSEKQVDQFSSNSKSQLKGLGKAFAALGAASVVKGIVEVGGSFQDLQTSLNVVFGGLAQGADAMKRVEDFAASTQFSVQNLSKAFIQLKGAGVEPTTQLLQTFADTASISTDQLGSFQAMLDLVTRSTAGGLGLEDLNRLADRGIPVFTILQEELGLARLEISKFGRTASGSKKIIDALLGSFDKKFGGALALQAKNINFQLNQMGDAFDLLKKATFGLFSDSSASAVEGLTGAINGLALNVTALSTSGFDKVIKGLLGIGAAIAIFASKGKILGVLNSGMKGFKDVATTTIIKADNLGKSILGIGVVAKGTFTPMQNLKAIFTNLGRAAKASVGNLPTGQVAELGKGFGFLTRVLAGFGQVLFSIGGAFTAFFRLALGPWGALAFAIDFILSKFLGFSILGVIFTSLKKLLGLFVQFAGFLIGKVVDSLKFVNEWFNKLGESSRAATKGVRDFLRSWGLLSKIPPPEGKELEDLNKQLNDANNFANAAADGMARFAGEMEKAIPSGEEFLKDSQAGKFATDLEKAQAEVAKAKQAVDTLAIALIGWDSALANGKSKEELEAMLAAARQAFGFASTELDNLNKSYADAKTEAEKALKAIEDAIDGDFGFEDLQIQIKEFDFPEVDQQVNAMFRELEDKFDARKLDLTNLIETDGLAEDVKANAQLALDALAGDLEMAKLLGEEFVRALFGKEQEKTFKDFQQSIKDASTFEALQALKEELAELGRTGELTANQVAEGGKKIEEAVAGLGASKGIKTALIGIAESMTPFQMAVDATTMVWGKMGSAIDDMVDNGKSSFSDLADSILKDLAKMIIKAYLFKLIVGGGKALGFDMSFLEGRAKGGPVAGGKPYMVGEQGPELFVPSSAGNIIPNGAGGGSVTNNNNYITNNINALDSKSVQQVFAENRQALLGTVEYARKETSYGV